MPPDHGAGGKQRAFSAGIVGGSAGAFPGKPREPISPAAFAGVSLGATVDMPLLEQLLAFMRQRLVEASEIGLHGAVIGLSGGLDSIVCAALCKRAAAGDFPVHTVTVRMPNAAAGLVGALADCAATLGIEHIVVDGGPAHAALSAAYTQAGPWTAINIDTRVIQALLFQVADAKHTVVAATTDRSEALLGRFTEAFYGQVAPLAGFYKTEVATLARLLGVDAAVVDTRPGCEEHWYDDEVMGCGYDVLDPLLHLIATGVSPREIAERYGVSDLRWLEAVRARVRLHSRRTATATFELERA